MYKFIFLFTLLSFSNSVFGQNLITQNRELKITIPINGPYIKAGVGFSPHHSSFNFDMLNAFDYGIQQRYQSLKYAPLINFKLTAGLSWINLNYQLTTTFPFRPTVDIYTLNGNQFNRSVYQEWTQIMTTKLNVYKHLFVGIGYHQRTIRFSGNTLSPSINFEFSLQKQKNMFLMVENLFKIHESFLLKPSLSASIVKWKGSGFNRFKRSPGDPPKNYTIPINDPTNYWSLGVLIGHEKILKNMRLNVGYEYFDNGFLVENYRYLFEIYYRVDVLKLF